MEIGFKTYLHFLFPYEKHIAYSIIYKPNSENVVCLLVGEVKNERNSEKYSS